MKKLVFIFSVLVLLSSCSFQEQYAKKAIKNYLKFTLNDFKSYEPVEYGKIERLSSSEEDFKKIDRNNVIIDSLQANEKSDSVFFYLEQNRLILKYLSVLPGWKMTHTFRARIPAGGYKLNHYLFYFNVSFTEVYKTFDLSEE